MSLPSCARRRSRSVRGRFRHTDRELVKAVIANARAQYRP
jgi:hypothetical protein